MAGTLINVRLNAADAAKVRALRKQGVELSTVVREAIRTEYERRRNGAARVARNRALLEKIYADYPVPEEVLPPPVDMSDRRARSRYITDQLRRKRNRRR